MQTDEKTTDERTLTPLTAIRKACVQCMGGSFNEVALCTESACPIHAYRSGKRPERRALSSLKSIRARCLYCAGTIPEVAECACHDNAPGSGYDNCPLYPLRFGKNPKLKGKRKNNSTPEGRQRGLERARRSVQQLPFDSDRGASTRKRDYTGVHAPANPHAGQERTER